MPHPRHQTTAGTAIEYDCQDCGVHVYSFGLDRPPSPPRCVVCQTIRDIPPGVEREDVRAALYDREAMEYWIETGSYIDQDYPERLCDACEKPYHGPAVYCSLACATADAGGDCKR